MSTDPSMAEVLRALQRAVAGEVKVERERDAWERTARQFETYHETEFKRAEAAEAQLAAVRTVLDEYAGSDHPEHVAIRAALDGEATR